MQQEHGLIPSEPFKNKVNLFGMTCPDRIGHLAMNTELYLRRFTKNNEINKLLIYRDYPVANRTLMNMIERKIEIAYVESENQVLVPDGEEYLFKGNMISMSNEFWEFNNIKLQLSFIPQEIEEGKKLLKEMGVNDNKYVCIHARTPDYMKQTHDMFNYDYHNYRDCDINSYMLACDYLTTMGYYVIRMGSIVDKPLETNNPKIIDYATKYRTDLGDIFLSAHCEFFLGCTAGLWLVPMIFGIPNCTVNSVPFDFAPLLKSDLYIPKVPLEPMPFSEQLDIGIDRFESENIPLRDNTQTEILELVNEMVFRMNNKWRPMNSDEIMQRDFKALWKPSHRCFGFPGRIGTKFLYDNKELIR